MKRKWLNELIVIFITILVLFFILKDNFLSTLKVIKNMNLLLFLIGIFMYIIVFSLEAIISMKLVKEYKKNYSFKDAFKLSLITRFFNGITPFSTGGRPLQVYELKKNGVRILDGTNVIVQNFIIFQTSLTIYSTIALISNAIFKYFPTSGFLYNMTIIGFVVNIFILLVALVFSMSKNLNRRIIDFIINAGSKIKLIKNKEKQYERFDALCNDYYVAFNDFKNKKKLIIDCVLIQIVSLTFFYSIVAVVLLSLGLKVDNLIPMIIASNFVFLTGCYVPIPGGSGGIEYAFMHYLEFVFTGGILSSVLIVWRFITYYLPTLVGGIVFNIRNKTE